MTAQVDRPLRIGIAGLGFGASVHALALLDFPDVEVVGLAGRSVEKAQATADKLGILKGCGSIAELLDLGLDAITLALPPDQVAAAVDAAVTRKIAVLCEKPLGTDSASSAALVQRASGMTSAMDFIFAELDVFVKLKQLIDSGTLGRVRHTNVLWLTESWAHRSQGWSWKTDADQYGGALSLFGSHLFYLAEWLLGPAESVFAHLAPSVAASFAPAGARAAEDLVDCHFQHASGASLSCTFGNANPGITMHRWTVVLDGGTVVVENSSADYAAFSLCIQRPGVAPEHLCVASPEGDGRLPPFRRLARRFIDAVRKGEPMQPDLAAGARVQRLDAGVRASAAANKEIRLD
jgi:predicted dehydrogenase